MYNDPLVEWQRLTETYRTMYDGELLELAAAPDELTEQARQVLGDEMRKRDLNLRSELPPAAGATRAPAAIKRTAFDVLSRVPEPVPDQLDAGEEFDGPREYTWKTLLCTCESQEEARQLAAMLDRAGIENWIERPGARYAEVGNEHMVGNLQVQVPADRLEEARQIAAQPIPEEIVEQSKMKMPEYEPPVCPKCGAGDPVLDGVDPSNSWRCEACGNAWSDSVADAERAEK